MPSPAIEVVDLSKRYGDRSALDGVTFSVGVAEVFVLLGPNGAGKTTTVEILEGFRRADGGRVRVLGLDPQTDHDRLVEVMGVMLQEGGVVPGMRVGEMVRLFASYYSDPLDPTDLVHAVGLGDVVSSAVRRLSGGESRRLSLALALVGRPQIVFLDEPTAGMDPRGRARTWEIVEELRSSGTTVVLTTHGLDEAEAVADRIGILDDGRIVALGTAEELTAPGDARTRFTARPGLDVGALAGHLRLRSDGVAEVSSGEYLVDAEITPALVADLTAWLRDRDVVVGDLRAARRSLHELYLEVTSDEADERGREGSS